MPNSCSRYQAILNSNGLLVEPQSNGTIYWRIVKAHQAKNWDGSPSGWLPNTPDGEREVLEKAFIPSDGSLPRYSNFWRFKK